MVKQDRFQLEEMPIKEIWSEFRCQMSMEVRLSDRKKILKPDSKPRKKNYYKNKKKVMCSSRVKLKSSKEEKGWIHLRKKEAKLIQGSNYHKTIQENSRQIQKFKEKKLENEDCVTMNYAQRFWKDQISANLLTDVANIIVKNEHEENYMI
jgi:hypothetical protein